MHQSVLVEAGPLRSSSTQGWATGARSPRHVRAPVTVGRLSSGRDAPLPPQPDPRRPTRPPEAIGAHLPRSAHRILDPLPGHPQGKLFLDVHESPPSAHCGLRHAFLARSGMRCETEPTRVGVSGSGDGVAGPSLR